MSLDSSIERRVGHTITCVSGLLWVFGGAKYYGVHVDSDVLTIDTSMRNLEV